MWRTRSSSKATLARGLRRWRFWSTGAICHCFWDLRGWERSLSRWFGGKGETTRHRLGFRGWERGWLGSCWESLQNWWILESSQDLGRFKDQRQGEGATLRGAYAEPFPWKLLSVTNGRKVELHAFLNQEIHKIYKLRQRGWSHVPSFTAEWLFLQLHQPQLFDTRDALGEDPRATAAMSEPPTAPNTSPGLWHVTKRRNLLRSLWLGWGSPGSKQFQKSWAKQGKTPHLARWHEPGHAGSTQRIGPEMSTFPETDAM